jgi:hypothetical protein
MTKSATRPAPIMRVPATGRPPFGLIPVTAASPAMTTAMPRKTIQFMRTGQYKAWAMLASPRRRRSTPAGLAASSLGSQRSGDPRNSDEDEDDPGRGRGEDVLRASQDCRDPCRGGWMPLFLGSLAALRPQATGRDACRRPRRAGLELKLTAESSAHGHLSLQACFSLPSCILKRRLDRPEALVSP